jgi:hypothetical protein
MALSWKSFEYLMDLLFLVMMRFSVLFYTEQALTQAHCLPFGGRSTVLVCKPAPRLTIDYSIRIQLELFTVSKVFG